MLNVKTIINMECKFKMQKYLKPHIYVVFFIFIKWCSEYMYFLYFLAGVILFSSGHTV